LVSVLATGQRKSLPFRQIQRLNPFFISRSIRSWFYAPLMAAPPPSWQPSLEFNLVTPADIGFSHTQWRIKQFNAFHPHLAFSVKLIGV
jgi:hypothetical protein